jgi:Fe(3+) dicitrate transport protein
MKRLYALVLLFAGFDNLYAQNQNPDTLKTYELAEVKVFGKRSSYPLGRMPEVEGTQIFSGKKNEIISVESLNADLSTNNSRQIFARVPGVMVWENDGSGIQTGVSTRGLSPNRSWEFNVRQNGYDISSEVFGYPEAYYTPPTEALSRIEIVRGAASLQNGPQFGGLLNYVVKEQLGTKRFSFESHQTVGSYGLFNSFNAIGGVNKKLSYYAFFHHRSADGWRTNSRYQTNTAYVSLSYQVNSRAKIGFQYTNMDYESQQPGGLTDEQFKTDARQSSRNRNWFGTPWNVMALTGDFQLNENTRINTKVFATLAERNSVGFVRAINVKDTFNTAINSFNPRQVDRDYYFNVGTETRLLHDFSWMGNKQTFTAGIRAYRGQTNRHQNGKGTSGSDFDLSIIEEVNGKRWDRQLEFVTNNYALYAEQLIAIGKNLQIIPGVRIERIEQSGVGFRQAEPLDEVNQSRTQNLVLFGIGSEYHVGKHTEFYGNFSQAFRPVTFADLTPSATTEIIDPNLQDAKGYNLDFGYRGNLPIGINFDVSVYYLRYENRIGTITQNNALFRTNIGASRSQGIEMFLEADVLKILKSEKAGSLTFFGSVSRNSSRYLSWNNPLIANDVTNSIAGKRVENAPEHITRLGTTYTNKRFSATIQVSETGRVFTDAANTILPNAGATVGELPGYRVWDAAFTYFITPQYSVRGGVNNFTDEIYATRRAGGYPGPGILPANGRTFFVTVSASF